jgi:hypothetical protein
MNIAIAILSFDRPNYLRQVLDSLKLNDLSGCDIYCFQDNWKTINGKIVAREKSVKKSIIAWKNSGIKGSFFLQPNNLAPALHFDFVEKLLFREKKYERVVFLEDDMVLQPNYISTLKYMFNKYGDDPRVAMISAYGSHYNHSLEDQEKNKHKLAGMHHNWAFGLTREFWERRQPFVEEYLEKFMYGVEYRERNNGAILSWLKEKGCGFQATSQDSIKEAAGTFLNAIKITCYPNLAKYIGRVGLHANTINYKKSGFDQQIIYSGEIGEMEDLTDDIYKSFLNYYQIHFSK